MYSRGKLSNYFLVNVQKMVQDSTLSFTSANSKDGYKDLGSRFSVEGPSFSLCLWAAPGQERQGLHPHR